MWCLIVECILSCVNTGLDYMDQELNIIKRYQKLVKIDQCVNNSNPYNQIRLVCFRKIILSSSGKKVSRNLSKITICDLSYNKNLTAISISGSVNCFFLRVNISIMLIFVPH